MRVRSLPTLLLATAWLAGCSRPGSSRDGTTPAAARPASSPPRESTAIVVPATVTELAARVRTGNRPTVLNVWATWCVPCREEFPGMLAVLRRHPGARLVLVSADFEAQLPEVRRFLAGFGVRDTTFWKRGGDQEFIDGLDPRWSGALPATFVYDAHGRRVESWAGAVDSSRFEVAISQASGVHP